MQLFGRSPSEHDFLHRTISDMVNSDHLTRTIGWAKGGMYFVISGDLIDPEYKELKVVITTKEGIQKVHAGALALYVPSWKTIIVEGWEWYFEGGVSWPPAGIDIVLQEHGKSFVHEFIHYLDSLRIGPEYFKVVANKARERKEEGELEDFAEYVSSPHEFNAFFQQAMAYTYAVLNKAISTSPDFDFVKTIPDAQTFVLVVNDIQRDVVSHLLPKYRRKWDKRVAMSYNTAKDFFAKRKRFLR